MCVWTPPGYEAGTERYPVVYMHDGQNLFDPRLASMGVDWGADEAMMRLAKANGGRAPAILVGIWNTAYRWNDYAPASVVKALPAAVSANLLSEASHDKLLSDAYLRFIVDVVKPRVDSEYRTRPERQHTSIAGSSMGGLISLYALLEKREVFGQAAGLSIHWPLTVDRNRIFGEDAKWRPILLDATKRYLRSKGPNTGAQRLWVDHGTETLDAAYDPYQKELLPVLEEIGFVEGVTLVSRVYEGTAHTEAAWRARLHQPLAFLTRASSGND